MADISREDAQKAFDAFDGDKNGVLDEKELFELAGSLGTLLNDQEVKDALAAIDSNGNGSIEFEEFYTWLTSDNQKIGEKGALTVIRLKASLAASKALRFMRNVGVQKQDVNIEFTVGEVKESKIYAQYQAMHGHILDKAMLDLVPEGGGYLAYDLGHNGGDFKEYLDKVFELAMTLIPQNVPAPIIKLLHPSENVARVVIITPRAMVQEREVQKVNEIINMVEAQMGEASVRCEYGFDTQDLINNPNFGIKDLAAFAFSLRGSVPYGLPHWIAQRMGMPVNPDPPVAPEGAREPIIDLQLNLSKGLIGMVLSAVPPVARLPFRELFKTFVVDKLKWTEENKNDYRPKRDRKKLMGVFMASRMLTATVARYITEIQGLHVRTKSGFGVTVEVKGLKMDEISALLESVDVDELAVGNKL